MTQLDYAMDEHKAKNEKSAIISSMKEMTDLLDEVEQHPLRLDEKWYLVSLIWWKNMLAALKKGSLEDITAIDNSKISDIVKKKYVLKAAMVEKIDYVIVPQKVFERLLETFGCDNKDRDIIERTVVNSPFKKCLCIEIYPRVVTVYRADDQYKKVELPAGRADTVGELRDRALDALGLARDKRVRCYLSHDDKYEPLEAEESCLVESVLGSDAMVVVDPLDENGQGYIRVPQSLVNDSSPVMYTRGVCGLQNLGNTCFMASALQCMSNVPPITEYFLSDKYLADINAENPLGTHGQLAQAYGQLLHNMWSGKNSCIVPRNLKTTIGRFAPRFSGYQQQDSQEFLAFLLDGLHEDLNRIKKKPYIEEEEKTEGLSEHEQAERAWQLYRSRNDSVIVDKVHGQLKSTLVCPQCEKVSVKFDPFCFLSVPLPPKDKPVRLSILLLFNPPRKWAKFSITVNRRSLVSEVLDTMRNTLHTPNANLVLFTVEGDRVTLLSPSSPILSNDARPKEVYASDVVRPLEEGSLLVARAFFNRKLLVLPMVFSLPKDAPIEEKDVVEHVLPFFHQTYSSKEEPYPPPTISFHVTDDVKYVNLDYDGLRLENYRGTDLVERECSVPLTKKDISLYECIDLFTKEEQLSEQDSWYCPRCKTHVLASKKLDLWRLPEILIIHLKRFQYSRWSREKIDTPVDIPRNNMHLNSKLANAQHEEAVYDLIGVSQHHGGLGGGHYVASALNGDKWYHFNDSSTSEMDSPPCERDDRSPYMLVFRRRQPPSPGHSDSNIEMEVDD